MSSDSSAMMSSFCSLGSQNLTAFRYPSRSCMTILFQDRIYGGIHTSPLCEQLLEDLFARHGELIETLVTLLFFAPFAFEQALAFQTPKQGIQRPFVNLDAMVSNDFSQRVAILLRVQSRQDRHYQASTPQFKTEIVKVF